MVIIASFSSLQRIKSQFERSWIVLVLSACWCKWLGCFMNGISGVGKGSNLLYPNSQTA